MSSQEHIKNSLFLASSSYLARLAGVIAGILVKRILGPVAVGSYTFITVIDSYVNYTYGIVRGAVAREIPVLRGAGKNEEVVRLYNSSNAILGILTILGSIVFIGFAILSNFNNIIKFGLIIYGILNIFQSYGNFYAICLSTEKKFKSISVIYFVSSVFQHISTLVLCYYYGYKGYFSALLLGAILSFILYRNSLKISFRWAINLQDIKTIFVLGSPLMLYSFMKLSFESIDKIVIQAYYPIEYLGFYNVGTSISILSILLPDSIYSVYMPQYLEHIGARNYQIARQKARELCGIMRTIMPTLLGLVWIFLGPTIHYILPAFKSGIMPARIYIIGIYFASFYTIYYYYLIGIRQFRYILYASAIALTFAIVANLLAVKLNLGLNGIAAAFASTQLIYSTIIILISALYMGETLIFFLKLLLKNIIYSLPIFMLFFINNYTSNVNILSSSIIMLAIFTLINLPFILKSNKEYSTISKIIFTLKKM